jgi:short-subunit dehydrogenase
MDKKYGPWALIIGGSEGIGRELALKLAARGLNTALTARKPAPLEETAAAVKRQSPGREVRTMSQDVTATDMLAKIEAFTADIDVGLLIYNAGAMNRVPYFLSDNLDGHLHTIRMNCEGPTKLCYHFGHRMRKRGGGGIMLMSSPSGLIGSPRTATYGATKAFDLLLAEALWYEMAEDNIDVMCLVVGLTATPSHERLMPGQKLDADTPEEIAQQGLDNFGKTPVWYAKSLQPRLDVFLNPDRRQVVKSFGDFAASFFNPGNKGIIANEKPFEGKLT